MAIWQYGFNIFKNEWLNEFLDKKKRKEFQEDIINIFWDLFEDTGNMIHYGSYEWHICSLILKEEEIIDVSCRLDLRIVTNEKILKILEFVNKYNLYIYSPEWNEIPQNDFLDNIKTSKNFSFVKDPKNFFKNEL